MSPLVLGRSSVLVELDFQASLYCTYQRSSRWVNTGTYAGTARDLLILVDNSKPGMWGIELLWYFRSKMPRERPTGFTLFGDEGGNTGDRCDRFCEMILVIKFEM